MAMGTISSSYFVVSGTLMADIDLHSTVLVCLYIFFRDRQDTSSTIDDATLFEKLSSNGYGNSFEQIKFCIEQLRDHGYVKTHDGSTQQKLGRIIVSSLTPKGNGAADKILKDNGVSIEEA